MFKQSFLVGSMILMIKQSIDTRYDTSICRLYIPANPSYVWRVGTCLAHVWVFCLVLIIHLLFAHEKQPVWLVIQLLHANYANSSCRWRLLELHVKHPSMESQQTNNPRESKNQNTERIKPTRFMCWSWISDTETQGYCKMPFCAILAKEGIHWFHMVSCPLPTVVAKRGIWTTPKPMDQCSGQTRAKGTQFCGTGMMEESRNYCPKSKEKTTGESCFLFYLQPLQH